MEEKKSRIVEAAAFIDALKSGGYKSTYNAIAEIVDNSFDAEADNVLIVGEQSISVDTQEKNIVSFAFFDDGTGMDEETLNDCLTIGYTTHHSRKGMGRFGVGLPQASFFVCDRVEVYSWQDGIENARMVYLDIDEIRKNNLNFIEPSVLKAIPEKYAKYLTWDTGTKKYDFTKKGTLVIWEKCTNVDHKKWNTCVNHMSMDIGRKYRYWINKYSKSP